MPNAPYTAVQTNTENPRWGVQDADGLRVANGYMSPVFALEAAAHWNEYGMSQVQRANLAWEAEMDALLAQDTEPESLFTPEELAQTVSASEWYEMVWQAQQDAEELRAEQAYERSLEDAGYSEARLQEDMEARMGIIEWPNPEYAGI